jgi:hypothetical protein
MNTVVVVRAGDWQGLFINDELKYENHEIDVPDLEEFLPINKIGTYLLSSTGEEMLRQHRKFHLWGIKNLSDLGPYLES